MTIAAGALARFQDDFSRALLAGEGEVPAAMAALVAQPAFAVYRNTVLKGCIDAVQANYPAVTRLVGEEWLRAAAAIYARGALPTQPMLLDYGAGFPDFLARFEPAAELPYLPAVARLDRCWTEAHAALSADPLTAATMVRFVAEDHRRLRLEPHPAARWHWCADAPAYTIWSRNRDEDSLDGEIDWRPEGALITRPRDAVIWRPIDRAGCAFLDTCAGGGSVADAAQAASDVDDGLDLGRAIAALFEASAFGRLHILDRPMGIGDTP